MSLDDKQRSFLRNALEMTKQDELDCDGFVKDLAAYVDGGIDDDALRALCEHHRKMCPECEEELQLLLRSLGRDK